MLLLLLLPHSSAPTASAVRLLTTPPLLRGGEQETDEAPARPADDGSKGLCGSSKGVVYCDCAVVVIAALSSACIGARSARFVDDSIVLGLSP